MKTYTEMLPHIEGNDYETHFWNAIRGKQGHKEHLVKGIDTATGAFTLTTKGQEKYMAAIKQEGLFRSLATDIQVYDHVYNIKTVEGDDVAVWVPEGGTIPITDGMADFSDIALASHKLAVFLKLEDALIRDPYFKVENDTILGHKVCISEFMPIAESGSKPIAFGDFSYYWIVSRRPVSVRTLTEQFAMVDCVGYLAYEFLDGKLVRPEAIKVMQMTA